MKARLLVIELHHFGDAVLTIPFLRAAASRYEVWVYCTPPVAQMLRSFLPGLKTIAAADRWPQRIRQAAGELRPLAPAVTVCAWSDSRADVIARLSGATRRIGFPMNSRNYYASNVPWRKRRLLTGRLISELARLTGWNLLTDPLQREAISESHFHNWERMAARLGLDLGTETPWFSVPEMELPPDLEKFIRSHSPNLWAVHPGGRLPTKRWPLDRFQEVLAFFAKRRIPTLIVQSPDEEPLKPEGDLQKLWPCHSHTDLAVALSHARNVLCNDSYPSHLAAALGKRVFPIFGSGEPAWFAPWQNSENVLINDICPHHPCVDRCVMPSIVCLDAVTVSAVREFLAPRLQGSPESSPTSENTE